MVFLPDDRAHIMIANKHVKTLTFIFNVDPICNLNEVTCLYKAN